MGPFVSNRVADCEAHDMKLLARQHTPQFVSGYRQPLAAGVRASRAQPLSERDHDRLSQAPMLRIRAAASPPTCRNAASAIELAPADHSPRAFRPLAETPAPRFPPVPRKPNNGLARTGCSGCSDTRQAAPAREVISTIRNGFTFSDPLFPSSRQNSWNVPQGPVSEELVIVGVFNSESWSGAFLPRSSRTGSGLTLSHGWISADGIPAD